MRTIIHILMATLLATTTAEAAETIATCDAPADRIVMSDPDDARQIADEWEDDRLGTGLKFVISGDEVDIAFTVGGSVRSEGGEVIRLPIGRPDRDISLLAVNPVLQTATMYTLSRDNQGRMSVLMQMVRASDVLRTGMLLTAKCTR